jgi:hypothetical protein
MRIKALAIGIAIGLLGVPGLANAAHAASAIAPTGVSPQPHLLPVRDGCGRGLYLERWQDRWGNWHRRCVPYGGGGSGQWTGPRGGPHGGRGCAPGWHWDRWRDRYGSWHSGCVRNRYY